jgi:hypothetical protein
MERQPEISRFYGIMITLYANDQPPPHFHARYAEREALIEIDATRLYQRRLPSRAPSLVFEWAAILQRELMAA